MDTDLNDILNNEAATDDTTTTETPEAAEARLRDEKGRFAAAAETGDNQQADQPTADTATPVDTQDAPQSIPYAAYKDEKAKRQEAAERAAKAETQLQQYEQYFQQLNQPQNQQPEVPDMYADPQGYTQWIASQVRDHIMQEVQQYGGQFETNNLVKVSELMARQRHEDYDQKVEVFKQAAAENPLLIDQLRQAPDPAMYAYQVAGKYLEAKQYGTAQPSRDDLKAEIRAELMAELSLSPKPTAPSSLASERSVGNRSGPAWAGPAAIGDILNQR